MDLSVILKSEWTMILSFMIFLPLVACDSSDVFFSILEIVIFYSFSLLFGF